MPKNGIVGATFLDSKIPTLDFGCLSKLDQYLHVPYKNKFCTPYHSLGDIVPGVLYSRWSQGESDRQPTTVQLNPS